ncbi:MAG: hypothetical protein GQ564_21185 [Bacteroidales bacterium]|nr:hypothetical protein [Bacteroidales bacterium]
MVLEENPITKELHETWRLRIQDRFGNSIQTNDCLSLIQYLDNMPNKFFSESAYHTYLDFLNEVPSNDIVSLLNECENSISHSLRILNEVNDLEFHDTYYPEDDLYLIDFIDKKIHYNYLKILETTFYNLIYLPSVHSRRTRGKSVEKLDLYNCIEELKNGDFYFLKKHYNNTIRNGIAHGKVQVRDNQFVYTDKKLNQETITIKRIVRLFDDLIDCVNGFVLALRVFYLSNINKSLRIPQILLIEELKYQADGPAWEIITSFEGSNIKNQQQLNLYIKNDFHDYNKVQYNAFRTAILTDHFTSRYNRIFINLKSSHSKFNSAGWVSFNGDKLRELNTKGANRIEEYSGVMDENLLFFVPKRKFPRLFYILGTYKMIFKAIMKLHWRNYIRTVSPTSFIFRECRTHAKSRYIVVERSSFFTKESTPQDLIRKQAPNLIRKAKKQAKKEYSRISFKRFLRVRYTKVFVYESNVRRRKFREGGLHSFLICIIHKNQTKQIKSPLPFGTVEKFRNYEIIWNDNWNNES